MKTPKFFELIGSFKGESSDPHFRVFVELADKDKDFLGKSGAVLVQILLSVCICLARSFVDSSGQDRGPNFRSGGCLSG